MTDTSKVIVDLTDDLLEQASNRADRLGLSLQDWVVQVLRDQLMPVVITVPIDAPILRKSPSEISEAGQREDDED